MKTKIAEFEVLIPNLDGTDIAERVKVPITLEWDEEVKEWLLTPEAHQIIEETKARRIGLLLPAQLKELRERYDYTHKKMGELFQVGEKSWTRWESGKHRPSRSINLLIRALYDGEISINYLLKRAGKPQREEPEWSSASSYWQYFAQCSLRDIELPIPGLAEQVAIVFRTGSGKSAFRTRMVQLLQQQPGLAEKALWTGSSHYTTRSAPALESSTTRFKFPSEA